MMNMDRGGIVGEVVGLDKGIVWDGKRGENIVERYNK